MPIDPSPRSTPGDGPRLDAEAVLDVLPHGVAVVDETGMVVWANRRWVGAGTDGDLVAVAVGADLPRALRSVDGQLATVAEHVADGLGRLLDGRGDSFEVQYRVTDDGDPTEVRWFLIAAQRAPRGGLVVTRTETTVHHGVHDVLSELAFHDDLTGLPNRSLVQDRMRMALIRAQRLDLHPLIAFVDLDGFKDINDRHGHAAGDAVLVAAAGRLSAVVREGDTCGRWGGDEFVLVIELSNPEAAPHVVDRLRGAFDAPVVLPDGTECPVTPSIGAVVADGSATVEDLIRRADEAMYEVKGRRRPRS